MSQQPKNKTTVDIFGQQYTIVGTESVSHIRTVAAMVDEKMREIKGLDPYLDIHKLAVLTAINVINDYLKLKDEYEKLEQKVKTEED